MPKRAMPYSAEYVRNHIQERITVEDRGHGTPCWIWQSGITGAGYATGHPAGCKPGLMHRMSYEASVAPIPKGLVIDHLCRVTRCVNPEHLEPVTQEENMRRSVGNWQHRGFRRTHCRNGHGLTPDNLLTRKGERACRKCNAAWYRAWRAKKAATRETKRGEGCSGQRPDSNSRTKQSHIAHDERVTRL